MSPASRKRLLPAAAGALLALAAAPVPAQHGPPPAEAARERARRPDPDPYLGEDRGLWQLAGVVSCGPFAWADRHGSDKIEEVLGDVPLRWLETAHFKIGSGLPAYKIPAADKEQRTKLRGELEDLAKVLPKVDPKIRELDPWLRLHLIAQRLEAQYRTTSTLLGVIDADFPTAPGRLQNGRYMGEGPHLGMPGKFTVLLLEKESDMGRYTLRFIGQQRSGSSRHLFYQVPEQACLFIGIATEAYDGWFADDSRLHCHLAFNVAHNLLHGYKYYRFPLPCWIAEGFAHWTSRRLDEQNNNWSGIVEQSPGLRSEWDWVPKIYARVKQDYYPPASELVAKMDYEMLRFADHMMIWSRVDYLLEVEDRARFARFLDLLSAPIPDVVPGVLPSTEQILAQQERAFRSAYEMDWAEFDRRWEAWVRQEFKKGKR